MMEEWMEIILAIVTVVLLIVTGYYGPKYLKAKKIFTKFRELMDTADNALADNEVTKEELHDILEKVRNLYYAIIGKKQS